MQGFSSELGKQRRELSASHACELVLTANDGLARSADALVAAIRARAARAEQSLVQGGLVPGSKQSGGRREIDVRDQQPFLAVGLIAQ
jgi:hypothetical protein